jgi:hypothetical protein
MTHLANSPWAKVYDENISSNPMKDDDIKEYFKEIIEKNKAAREA